MQWRGKMKKLTKRGLVAAIVWGLSGVVFADNDAGKGARGCGLSTLDGMYIFAATGYIIPASGPAQPKAIVEWIRFNGDGTLSSAGATRSLNGVIAQIPSANGAGSSYTVTELEPPGGGCKGSLAFSATGPNFDLFIPPKGEEIWMIQTNPNNVFQGTATQVSR
jgi:hypothetical protein